MSDSEGLGPEEVMWEGRFITARRRGKWEYAGRARSIRAAVILALDESGDEPSVILVEQFRVPLQKRCLELPAGLIGDADEDEGGDADEDASVAAARELEEETGYRAGTMDDLGEFYSSPGMVSESFTLFRARDLVRVSDGGGLPGEDITVHIVALSNVPAFIAGKRADGWAMDVKLLMLLGGGFLAA